MRSKTFQLIDGQLVEQSEASYEQEVILQRLLMENLDLVDGDQINEEDPRRWLLVKREAPVLVNDEIGNYSSFVSFLESNGENQAISVVYSSCHFEIYFQYLKRIKPFDQLEKRLKMLNNLNKISGISIRESKINYCTNLPFELFETEDDWAELFKIHESVVSEIRKSEAKVA